MVNTAGLRLRRPPEEPNHTLRVQFCIVSASDLPLLAGVTQSFTSIRIRSLNNRLNTKFSSTAEWHHTFPPLLLSSCAVVELEIRERCLIKRKLLASAKTTVQDMLQRANEHNVVVLTMTPCRPHRTTPILTISIRVYELDVAFISAQLGNLKIGGSSSPNEHFQQILRRLEYLTHFTSGIAQLNPISNAVYVSAKGIAQTVKDRLAINEKLSALIHRIHTVLDFVELAEPIATIERFPEIVKEILACIERCILFISKRQLAGPVALLFSDDQSQIENLQEELEALKSIMSKSMTLSVARNSRKVEEKMREIRATVSDRQLRLLNPLSMPLVSPHFRTTCFPGTRLKVISELIQWGLWSADKILWMHAHAGSGKSAISTTMANVFEREGRLGSFVFFNRDVEERSEPSGMIRTIAYQLGCHRKDIADGIRGCVEKQPRISELTLEVQFQRLLVDPLTSINIKDRVVIIIDALDEGGDGPSQTAFLSLLSRGLPQLPDFVRVLITSRNYPRIHDTFVNIAGLRVLDLDKAPDTDDDIRIYIAAQMDAIRYQYSELSPGWPGNDAVDSLVQHAHGLFIWATVACSFIQAYNPAARLQTLLSNPSIRALSEHSLHNHSLNNLYGIAIRDAGPWDAEDFAKDMHDLLAVIIVSQNPQSLHGIGDILGIDAARIADLVSRLQSILKQDENGLIHVFHPSVRDYLVDIEGHAWSITEPEEHIIMAARCIHHLNNNLHRNTTACCSLDEKTSRITLTDAVAYACVSWVHHVCNAKPTAQVADEIHGFMSTHILHWMEALKILGQSRDSITWLKQLWSRYSNFESSRPAFDSSFNALLYDAWRFSMAFSKTIETDPSLVYETALRFCPKSTSIPAMFIHDEDVTVVSASLRDGWSPCLMTLAGLPMEIASLSLSNSGNTIAGGCINGTLKVWNVKSGTEIFTTPTHPDNTMSGIVSTLLSSDGRRLFCGLLRGNIRVLDVTTGKFRSTFNVESKSKLICAALAADDHTLICGYRDGLIQLLDTNSQLPVALLLVGHDATIYAVAFSHNQQMVISGSEDNTIRVWSRAGVHQFTFRGHAGAVYSVAFSPDDSRIASASADGTMKIWDSSTGSELFTCRHNRDENVCAVAFSHNGDWVATGSSHNNIRIWDYETGEQLISPLSLHRGPVLFLSFAPDDRTLISGSRDSHIRIWSLVHLRRQPFVQPVHCAHTGTVQCVALSHDQQHFVSGSADASVIVWSSLDGSAVFPPLLGHKAEIVAVDISRDDKVLVSTSKDGEIYFWSLITGQMYGAPLHSSEEIVSIRLSPDALRLASITKNNELILWNVVDKVILLGPLTFPGRDCKAIAFSNDGTRLATLCGFISDRPMEHLVGLAITLTEADSGNFVLDRKIDDAVKGGRIYWPKIEYDLEDRYLVIRYAVDDLAFTKAFDAVTGTEYDPGLSDFPELNRLAAVGHRITRRGRTKLQLPPDLDHIGRVTCWESAEDIIVVGTMSGDVYLVSCKK
ncbi:YVTN repeat-like/Quino protein amine dehydrogenase [Mycena venus]|uniref:YVTN repeat-like/Quino protein amine dehydrogenase n=1 Tax=Mycena venus TaxID=2733690 RepID=A0A8H7CEF1_9AGAR|nr:YVTN repeat-like/Quino protein amine dehydrogenase [Mycena venus]